MIKGVHTMLYTSEPEALRAFLRDKLGFPHTDVGEGRFRCRQIFRWRELRSLNSWS